MAESSPQPKSEQPPLTPPEKTGNVITDKANLWLYAAQWYAYKEAREEDVQIADELGLPKPEPTHSPEYKDAHSAILSKLASTMDQEGTQQMLATLHDMRETAQVNNRGDLMHEQMQILQAVFENPDLS